MTDQQRRALAERAAEEAERVNDIALPIYLNVATAQMLIANLYLALRHPRNDGPASQLARELIDGLINQMAELGAAANVQIAQLGEGRGLIQ